MEAIFFGMSQIEAEYMVSKTWFENFLTQCQKWYMVAKGCWGMGIQRNISKIIQALSYLLQNIGPTDKIKVVKMMYLADKCHLLRYGRTITGDSFYALPYGPVGSLTLDILDGDPRGASAEQIEDIGKYIGKPKDNTFSVNNKMPDYDLLSESDIEAIDFIIEKYLNKGTWGVVDDTHQRPEFKQFEEALKSGRIKSFPIPIENLLWLNGADDPLYVPENHIREIELLLQGK